MGAVNMTKRRRRTSGQVPPRLYGAAEAAEALGVLQQNLRPIPGLPEPVALLKCGMIWLADDIEEFARARSTAA